MDRPIFCLREVLNRSLLVSWIKVGPASVHGEGFDSRLFFGWDFSRFSNFHAKV